MFTSRTNGLRLHLLLPLLAAAVCLFGILQPGTAPRFSPSAAIAAPVPTPTAATQALISAPVPNPVPYNFAPTTTAASAQVNTDIYSLWQHILAIETALNGCSYVPGGAIGAVTLNAPLTGSLTSCVAGTGVGSTLTLSVSAGGTTTYTASGGAVAGTYHCVNDTVTSPVGGTTTFNFTGSAAFSSINSRVALVQRSTAGFSGNLQSFTANTTNSVSWSTSAGDIYSVLACGI